VTLELDTLCGWAGFVLFTALDAKNTFTNIFHVVEPSSGGIGLKPPRETALFY